MVNVTVGHKVSCTIVYLDQNGNPMLTAQTVDSPPAWTNTTPATDTLVVSADGSTCEIDAIAVGADTVNLTVVSGGKTFTAVLQVTVGAAPQVLTSVEIATTVS